MSRLGALGDRRFRRLFAGQALSNFGDSALYLTLGIWAKTLTGSSAAAGGVFLALAAPALLAPVAGQLADRMRRQTLMITVNAVTALAVLTLVFVRSDRELWLIYAVALVYGTSFGILGAAGAGLRKDMLAGQDLASANALLQLSGQGLRALSPLAGTGLFAAFGGPAVAVFDAVTFGAAIAAVASLKITESEPEKARGTFWRDTADGFRHIRAVPLLAQITLASGIAFSVIGLNETIIFAVVGQGLHRPPSFNGVLLSVQGAGAVAGGLTAAFVMRRAGTARTVGLALAWFAVAALAYRAGSVSLVCAGSAGDGAGVVWLSAGLFTALQQHTPPRLQGRVNGAATAMLITPQTMSIAAGTALISLVSYQLMLIAVAVVIGGCAAWLLARPASPPAPAEAAPAEPAVPGSGDHPEAGRPPVGR